MTITITGEVSVEEVYEALAAKFPNRKIRVMIPDAIQPSTLPDELVISASPDPRLAKYETLLVQKDNTIKELEITSNKALLSIQSFHKQQQALFDEFVLLRQRYDEQKSSLLSILWIHCGQYHPDVRLIPRCEDEDFTETDEQVGNYAVGNFLGEGQFATVRTCWELGEDGRKNEEKVYALKTIKKEKITTLQSLKRVSNEIEILRKLKSKNIVVIHDVLHTTNMLYIVTEKGGADLFEFFDEHPDGVPEKWAKDIITYVLRAVHYCHEHQVCHRGS